MKWLITWLLLAASAFAANTCNATGGGTGSNCTLTGVVAHHLLLVGSQCAAAGPCTISDSLGLTWQPVTTVPMSVIGSSSQPSYFDTLYWANTGTSSGNDVITQVSTAGVGGVNSLVAIEETLDYVFDVNAYAGISFFSTTGALLSGPIVPTVDSELLVSIGDCVGGPSFFGLAGGSPFTQQVTAGGNCLRLADRTLGAGTAGVSQSVTWNHSQTRDEDVVLAAFRPAVATPANPVNKCSNGFSNAVAVNSSAACTITVSPNHVLVVAQAGHTATISDSLGLTWNATISHAPTLQVWYASTAGNTGPVTITVNMGGVTNYGAMLAAEYSNPPTLDALAYSGTKIDGGNRNTAALSVTTAAPHELIVAVAVPTYGCLCVGDASTRFAGSGYLTPITVGWLSELWEPTYGYSIRLFDNVDAGVAGPKTFTLNQNEDVSYSTGDPNNSGGAYYAYTLALLAFGPRSANVGVLKEVWIY